MGRAIEAMRMSVAGSRPGAVRLAFDAVVPRDGGGPWAAATQTCHSTGAVLVRRIACYNCVEVVTTAEIAGRQITKMGDGR